MPSLLLANTTGLIGGSNRIIASIAAQLSSADWDVTTFIPENVSASETVQWFKNLSVTASATDLILPMEAPHTRNDIVKLSRYIRKTRPDVVNLHYGYCYTSLKDVLAVRLGGCSNVYLSCHGLGNWSEMGGNKKKMTALSSRLSRGIITTTKVMNELMLEAGIPKNRLHIINCGIKPPANIPDKQYSRSDLSLPSDAFIICVAARLVFDKGIAELIQAISMLGKEGPLPFLLVAGDGELRNELELMAETKIPGQFKFLGNLQTLDSFYAASDIVALPTWMEGFGLTLIEAAFVGLPSIASRVGGVPEAVIDGETGILVPPRDPMQLMQALKRMHIDTEMRLRMGVAARDRANKYFTETCMTEAYNSLFNKHIKH